MSKMITNKTKHGIIRSSSSLVLSPDSAKIEINNGQDKLLLKRKNWTNYTIYDSADNIIVTSRRLSKSVIKLLLGTSGLVFFQNDKEICKIEVNNQYVSYFNTQHPFDILIEKYYWRFKTDDFSIILKKRSVEIEIEYKEKYMIPCLCYGVYMWCYYIHQMA